MIEAIVLACAGAFLILGFMRWRDGKEAEAIRQKRGKSRKQVLSEARANVFPD